MIQGVYSQSSSILYAFYVYYNACNAIVVPPYPFPLTPYPTTPPSVPSLQLFTPTHPRPLASPIPKKKILGATVCTAVLYFLKSLGFSTRQWGFRSFPPTRLLGSWGWTCPVGNGWMMGGLRRSVYIYVLSVCASLFPVPFSLNY